MVHQPSQPREQFQTLRKLLLTGLLSLSAVTVVLTRTGVVPMSPDTPWVGEIVAVASGIGAAIAWFWARARVPIRRAMMPVDQYWKEADTLGAAHLALFMLEGSAMLGIVGTMMAGFGAATAVALLPVLGMVALTPESLEQRSH